MAIRKKINWKDPVNLTDFNHLLVITSAVVISFFYPSFVLIQNASLSITETQTSTSSAQPSSPTQSPSSTDSDSDGFTDAIEAIVGTDVLSNCSKDLSHAAWPPDINNDKKINTVDSGSFVPVLNSVKGDGRYQQRLDLNIDGKINTIDVGRLVPYLNRACEKQTATLTSNKTGFLRFQKNTYPSDYGTCSINPNRSIGQPSNLTVIPNIYWSDRAYLSFDTSAIPLKSDILSAELELTVYGNPRPLGFNINVREFDWGTLIECPSTLGDDWGGNPPSAKLVGTFNASTLPSGPGSLPGTYTPDGTKFTIKLSDVSVVKKGSQTRVMLSSSNEEQNIKEDSGQFFGIYREYDSNISYRPKLVVEYK